MVLDGATYEQLSLWEAVYHKGTMSFSKKLLVSN